jgi:hypothetical protein
MLKTLHKNLQHCIYFPCFDYKSYTFINWLPCFLSFAFYLILVLEEIYGLRKTITIKRSWVNGVVLKKSNYH